ncbi:MAG: hypothetical protein MUO26_10900 [Methanotrichaceae archaeon]|nr:hypothetical protein [Methanotrichaceae archaeon]
MKTELVLILVMLSLSECLVSTGVDMKITSSYFDMNGTITNVLTPSSIIIGNEEVKLEGVDPYGLYSSAYAYLVEDLKNWLIGKDVFVKGNYVYFDLNGAYNSISINEMIQKEIIDLWNEQYYYQDYYPDQYYDGGYYANQFSY